MTRIPLAERLRRARGARPSDRVGQGGDEEGYTLVELAITVVVLGILLAITLPIVASTLQTTSRVNTTYSNVDEQLWLSTVLQRLVRAAVAPAPTVTPVMTPGTTTARLPVPAFQAGSITPTSMTFYTNIGTRNGPAKVVATCAPATPTTPMTDHTVCPDTATLRVTLYKAKATSCPTSTSTSKRCTYPNATRRTLITITHLQNGNNGKPLFVFAYGAQPSPGDPMVTTTVCTAGLPAATCSSTPTASSDSKAFTTCTQGTPTQRFSHCLAGEIQYVSYDVQINTKKTKLYGGAQAEDDTGIFTLSSTSTQYQPSVG